MNGETMLLPSLVLTGLLAAGPSKAPLLAPDAATVQLVPEKLIRPGMTENQVERLLGEGAGGTLHFGCGFCRPEPVYIRLYERSKVMVLYQNGKVTTVRCWK